MIPQLHPALVPLFTAVPPACQQRLVLMGWSAEDPSGPARRLRDPERTLRRAIGGPQQVSLVDLELDPERFHGRYILTAGPISWHKRPGGSGCLGRLWVDTTVISLSNQPVRVIPTATRVRILGVLLADPQVRAAHLQKHKEPGGYGLDRLFIAQLAAIAIQPETPAK